MSGPDYDCAIGIPFWRILKDFSDRRVEELRGLAAQLMNEELGTEFSEDEIELIKSYELQTRKRQKKFWGI